MMFLLRFDKGSSLSTMKTKDFVSYGTLFVTVCVLLVRCPGSLSEETEPDKPDIGDFRSREARSFLPENTNPKPIVLSQAPLSRHRQNLQPLPANPHLQYGNPFEEKYVQRDSYQPHAPSDVNSDDHKGRKYQTDRQDRNDRAGRPDRLGPSSRVSQTEPPGDHQYSDGYSQPPPLNPHLRYGNPFEESDPLDLPQPYIPSDSGGDLQGPSSQAYNHDRNDPTGGQARNYQTDQQGYAGKAARNYQTDQQGHADQTARNYQTDQQGHADQTARNYHTDQQGHAGQTAWNYQTDQQGHAGKTARNYQTARRGQTHQTARNYQTARRGQTDQTARNYQTDQQGQTDQTARNYQTARRGQTDQTARNYQTARRGQTDQTVRNYQTDQQGHADQTARNYQTDQQGHAGQTARNYQTDQQGHADQTARNYQTDQQGHADQTARNYQTDQQGQTDQTARNYQTDQQGQTDQTARNPRKAVRDDHNPPKNGHRSVQSSPASSVHHERHDTDSIYLYGNDRNKLYADPFYPYGNNHGLHNLYLEVQPYSHPSNPYTTDLQYESPCGYQDDQHGKPPEICEWTTVFKAVAGNGRSVFEDYVYSGDLNVDVPSAISLSSELVYRDGSIMDNWDHLVIEQVKMEMFLAGKRKTWFIYDGLGSTFISWMSPERLVASPFPIIHAFAYEEGGFDVYGVVGIPGEFPFFIGAFPYCFLVGVMDDCAKCPFVVGDSTPPAFFYSHSPLCDLVFMYEQIPGLGLSWSPADRFVISVKMCDGAIN